MALPASGNSISLDQIHVELGESSGSTVALGDDDVRALASDTSGAIGMNQFFGLSNTLDITTVFKTITYTGNSSTQNINTGLNMQSNHGLVLTRRSDSGTDTHLNDTVTGRNASNVNTITGTKFANRGYGVSATANRDLTTFNTNGFGVGQNFNQEINRNGATHCAWTFMEDPAFFDIVTYTGSGSGRTVAHSLDAVPGMIIVKDRGNDEDNDWVVWHTGDDSATQGYYLLGGNDFGTIGTQTSSGVWNNTAPTASVFSVGAKDNSPARARTNENGRSYVAYLFADTDNLIKCGKVVHNSSTAVDLGFSNSSQFIMLKGTTGGNSAGGTDINDRWNIFDNVNGITNNGNDHMLEWSRFFSPETNAARINPTSAGFTITSGMPNDTYLYMAIAASS